MTESKAKADLARYLQSARNALLWKLDGLSEYDIRRPLTPTGTNLLGLVKHAAGVEVGYFGDTFRRPFGEALPWLAEDAEPNADLWATADESREYIVALYQRVWRHADATITELALDATGHVPWWIEGRQEVTLHQILVHVTTETSRHAGHADIVRELLDGAVGMAEGNDNMPAGDRSWWENHRERLERTAREAVRQGDTPTP
ncbi:DinB family protein [Streptomyces sp. NPDC058691]|uniref:DinB family protein n=1 Tax=Streptomyces sp. NPDC058691 TaxID=3346601 RepID=UPI00364A40CC